MLEIKKRLLGILLLLVGCSSGSASGPLPTRIIPAEIPAFVTPAAVAASQLAAGQDGGQSIGDPYLPELGNTGYDVESYTLKLALRPGVEEVRGTAVIRAITVVPGLSQLSLDFVGFQVSQVLVNRVPASFSRAGKKLVVELPQVLPAASTIEMQVVYQGKPVREKSPYVGFTDALGLGYAGETGIYTLSEPDGARYWFPSNDHPRDKALFRFELTVPVGLTAVANGQLTGIENGELESLPGGGTGRTFFWEHNYPMATYLAVVAVGRFERIEGASAAGVRLRHYVTGPYRNDLSRVIAKTGEAIDWMGQLFGPYPFEVFGYVAMDMPQTAMESQTMVILANDLIGERTAVHELAHMWFGNWVSPASWSEMWRKEGFATYVTLMWLYRDNPDGLDQEMDNLQAAVAQNSPQYPIGNPPAEYLLGYNTYQKGAVFIHTLRRDMGDDAFFSGVRTYLQRYGGGTASDAEFRAVMEEAAGRSLVPLFEQWLN